MNFFIPSDTGLITKVVVYWAWFQKKAKTSFLKNSLTKALNVKAILARKTSAQNGARKT